MTTKKTRGASRLRLLYIGLLFAPVPVPAADTADRYAGSEACKTCHPAEYAAQSRSGHARALARSKAPQQGEWAFGAGSQAITFVHQRDRDTYIELGQSWFREIDGLAATPGHPKGEDVPYRTFDPSAGILRCFACHSTGPLTLAAGQKIVPHEPGVRCEACHGPAGEHSRDPARQAPVNPGRYTADAINGLCGDCHRMPAGAQETTDLRDPWNSRHQPLTLAASVCYRSSNGRLSCLTCHSPHAAVERTAAKYDAKCAGCHPGVQHTTAIAGKSCVECHMPAVRPQHHLEFANHRIGIYSASDPLNPVPRKRR